MRNMNTPNKLTVLRIFLVIPFVVLFALFINEGVASYKDGGAGTWYLFSSGIVFVLAMITDFIDGYLARKNNQVTTFGKLFDPLADKFMTTSAFIMLSVAGIVPFWITLIFILRDILVDGSRNIAASNNVSVAASFWGKAKTMLQSIGIAVAIFLFPVYEFPTNVLYPEWETLLLILPIIGATILSVVSGYQYLMAVKPYLKVS